MNSRIDRHSDGPTGSSVAQPTDITALVDRDELTNLFNRRYFKRRLEEERADADKQGHPLSILMIDVDRFKEVNDNFGHSVGDTVLKKFARLLEQSVRDLDICCRYAGDEFVAILPDADEEDAQRVAERIRRRIHTYGWEENINYAIDVLSVSIGYAVYPKQEVNLSMLFDRADMALYNAKRMGRNRVSGRAHRPTGVEDPSQLTPPFLHRDKETLILENALRDAELGKGSVLFVIGEAGVGKTSLLSNFRRQTMLCRVVTLTGSSYSETAGIPYYPFRELLNQVSLSPRFLEEYGRLKPVHLREIQKIAPELAKDAEPSDATYVPDKYLLFDGILTLFNSIAQDKPLMLIFEDINWADEASMSLLKYIGRNASPRKMMVCATARTEELASKDSSKAELRSFAAEKFCQTVELRPFTERQTQNLLRHMLPKAGATFSAHLHSMSQGNPFFLIETVRSIPGDKMESVLEARSRDELKKVMDVPKSIHNIIDRRLEKLDEEGRKVLSCAAVLGNEFGFNALCSLTEMNEGNLLDVLDRAVDFHFIGEKSGPSTERYGFRHVLLADSLYRSLSPKRRAGLHERAASFLENEGPEVLRENSELLAHHFGEAGNPDKEYEYSKMAGKKAFEAYANTEAKRYYDKAARLVERIDAARRSEESMEMNVRLAQLEERVGDYESAEKRFESVLKTARESKNRQRECDALANMGIVHERTGSFDKSLAFYRKSLAIAEELGEKKKMAGAMLNVANTYLNKGNYRESRRYYEAGLALFEEAGDELGKALNLCNMGVVLMHQGDYDKALSCYQESLYLRDKRKDLRGKIYSLNNIGAIYYLRGDYEASFGYREQALTIAEEIEHKKGMALALQSMAILKKEMGDFEEAKSLVERCTEIADEMRYRVLSPRNKVITAEVQSKLGDSESAARNCTEAIEESKQMGSKQLEADAHRVMGLIQTKAERFKEANEELKNALRCYKEIEMKEGTEEVYHALGKLEESQGHKARARKHLLKAKELYEESGNRTWTTRINTELDQL